MDYQFKYKLPDGLQAKPAPEKNLGVGHAKHVLLEGRPASTAKPATARSTAAKKSISQTTSLTAILGSAALVIAGSAWYLFAPSSASLAPAPMQHQVTTAPARTSMPVVSSGLVNATPESPAGTQQGPTSGNEIYSEPSHSGHGQEVSQHEYQADVRPSGTRTGYENAPEQMTTSQSTPTGGANSANYENQGRASTGRVSGLAAEETAPPASEPEPPRNKWRAAKSEAYSNQRRPPQPKALHRARQADSKGSSKSGDRERLF